MNEEQFKLQGAKEFVKILYAILCGESAITHFSLSVHINRILKEWETRTNER